MFWEALAITCAIFAFPFYSSTVVYLCSTAFFTAKSKHFRNVTAMLATNDRHEASTHVES